MPFIPFHLPPLFLKICPWDGGEWGFDIALLPRGHKSFNSSHQQPQQHPNHTNHKEIVEHAGWTRGKIHNGFLKGEIFEKFHSVANAKMQLCFKIIIFFQIISPSKCLRHLF
jgi:hypothetical protein